MSLSSSSLRSSKDACLFALWFAVVGCSRLESGAAGVAVGTWHQGAASSSERAWAFLTAFGSGGPSVELRDSLEHLCEEHTDTTAFPTRCALIAFSMRQVMETSEASPMEVCANLVEDLDPDFERILVSENVYLPSMKKDVIRLRGSSIGWVRGDAERDGELYPRFDFDGRFLTHVKIPRATDVRRENVFCKQAVYGGLRTARYWETLRGHLVNHGWDIVLQQTLLRWLSVLTLSPEDRAMLGVRGRFKSWNPMTDELLTCCHREAIAEAAELSGAGIPESRLFPAYVVPGWEVCKPRGNNICDLAL